MGIEGKVHSGLLHMRVARCGSIHGKLNPKAAIYGKAASSFWLAARDVSLAGN